MATLPPDELPTERTTVRLDALTPDPAESHTEDLHAPFAPDQRVTPERPLRAVIDDAQGRRLGRITEMSAVSLWVETHAPLELSTEVDVALALPGAPPLRTRGRVARRREHGMGIRLESDKSSIGQRAGFVAWAAHPGTEGVPEVRIRPSSAVEGDEASEATLAELWAHAARHLDDDALQQRFIQACLELDRMQFALDRFRGLREDPTQTEVADRYLGQIGLLLGFAALKPVDADDAKARRRRGRVLTLGLAAALIALGAALLGDGVELANARSTPSLQTADP